MLKKFARVVLPAFFGLFLFAGVASAHVTVSPATSTTGAWETYTIKVPTEKNIPTTKVTIKTPKGVEIESYEPVPGWTYSAEKGSDGKTKTFTFKADGKGILPGQFQQFTIVATNPNRETEIAWDAYQYYKDGSIVEWTQDKNGDNPHSITKIVKGSDTGQAQTHDTTTNDDKTSGSSSNTLPLILSIVSVVLSLVALITAFRKK